MDDDELGEGLIDFGVDLAVVKAVEKNSNEIKFDNFVPQARAKKILTLSNPLKNKECEKYKQIRPDSIAEAGLYTCLYDALVKCKPPIIKSVLSPISAITGDYVYTIEPSFVEIMKKDKNNIELKKRLTPIPKGLVCYDINYSALADLLINYNYNYT